MIGTEFIKGQGLGNQLFAYVTARAIAEDKGLPFGTAGQDRMGVNIHSDRGMYFMDIDLGVNIPDEDISKFGRYDEKEVRLYAANSKHDVEHGVYVAGVDENLMSCYEIHTEHDKRSLQRNFDDSIHNSTINYNEDNTLIGNVTIEKKGELEEIHDNTLLYGNLQSEAYFSNHLNDLKDWLKVKEEYDSYEYTRDDLCIMNMRGGEYTDSPELFIGKKYWLNAMAQMKKINPAMKFMIISDDVAAARRMFPDIEAHHFDVGKDYVTVKNARYLILSNSSFAVLAAYTSDTLKYAIAPKYWARYNVSDGYWASEQNIYSKFHYQDRKGRLFTPEECQAELNDYKKSSRYLSRIQDESRGLNGKPEGLKKKLMLGQARCRYYKYHFSRLMTGIRRRILAHRI